MQWFAKNFLNLYLAALVVTGYLIRDDLFGGSDAHPDPALAQVGVEVVAGDAVAAGPVSADPVAAGPGAQSAPLGSAGEQPAPSDIAARGGGEIAESPPVDEASSGGANPVADQLPSSTALEQPVVDQQVAEAPKPVPPPADDPSLSDVDYARAVEADREGRPLSEVLGDLTAGSGDQSGATRQAVLPAPLSTPEQFEDAINQARRAFWSNNMTEAVHSYARVLDAQPDNWAILGELGNVLMTVGQVDKALRVYEESARLMWAAGDYLRAWQMTRVIARYSPDRAMDLAQGFTGGGTPPAGQQ
ncbi:MAG: hypothetical protein ACPGUC_07480 [Gammaproteobacteria bacterium]